MAPSFLDLLIERYYPKSSEKIREIVSSNILLDKLTSSVYKTLEENVQQYVEVSERITTLVQIIQDWRKGAYHTVSYKNISIGVFVLLYFVNPYDFIPDFIPVVGKMDDTMFLKKGLEYLDEEINKYKTWKQYQSSK